MDARAHLESLMRALLGQSRDMDAAEPSDDWLFPIGNRIVQLRLGADGLAHVSSPIHDFEVDGNVNEKAISEFNGHHLFAGGYSLHVDDESHIIFMDQAIDLTAYSPQALHRHLQDFAGRATSCSSWIYGLSVDADDDSTEEQVAKR